jgi:hypothetical protein
MISRVAIDRILERKAASSPKYREQVAGRALRSAAAKLTDDELLARLKVFGIEIDRSWLGQRCREALSAQEIADPLMDERHFRTNREKLESDWIWTYLDALWQRWCPEEPSFESLDDKMQAGYELSSSDGPEDACRTWLETWNDVLRIFEKSGVSSIEEFDDRFAGTQSLFNWIQDFESELGQAGVKAPQFLTARIALCEELLQRFPSDDLPTENFRRAMAESYFELGEVDKGEALFQQWLRADPRGGWIGWSDCYRFTTIERQDWNRYEQILREGLAIPEVRYREDIVARLADACEHNGRAEEAEELRREAERVVATVKSRESVSSDGQVLHTKSSMTFSGAGVPLDNLSNLTALMRGRMPPASVSRVKIGRNEPCPCGSGKKFKKCCGA